MHIVVCVKRVPDTTAKIRPASDGKSIDPAGVEFILSTYDEIALERAVQLKEAGVATKVTVLSLGEKGSTKDLRKALAVGADAAVLLDGGAAITDPVSTAEALAAAITELSPDAVFCGWKAIDDDSSAVGGYIAARLGFAYTSFATGIEAKEGAAGTLVVTREVEGATQIVELPTPCVITAQKGLAEPRFAKLKEIMKAKRKPLTEQTAQGGTDGGSDRGSELVAITPPPARPEGRIVGQGADGVPELVRVLKDEVHVL